MNPRVYIACLASYNAGILYGAWIDADQDVEDIQAEIHELLACSSIPNAEEWAIHDTEDMGDLISESSFLTEVSAYGKMIAEHGEAWLGYASFLTSDIDLDALEIDFLNAYQGEYDSKVAFAEEYFHDCYSVPSEIASYINYEAFARDLFMDYYSYPSSNGGIYVYRA